MHFLCKSLIRGVALAGLVAAWLATAGTASAATQKPAAAKAPVATAADYAGQDTCLGCHEDKSAVTKAGAHARAFNPKTPNATMGCESCHGAGKAHAEAGGDKTKIAQVSKLSAQAASELCTTCHDRKTHALWAGSQHDNRNVGCTQLPQRPLAEEREGPAEGEERVRAVRLLPPRDREQAESFQPHAGARGQDVVRVVPQRARQLEPEAAQDGHDD